MENVSDRALLEQIVARTARRPQSAAEIATELERQTLYHPEPDDSGLDELAGVLGRRLVDGDIHADDWIGDLERTFAHQPLIHLYGFAMRREAGRTLPLATASMPYWRSIRAIRWPPTSTRSCARSW